MFITELEVKNFKSFEHLNIKLKPFNVLIGANASGKSNFVRILQFLSDIGTDGLQGAVSLHGGMKYLRNVRAGDAESIGIRVAFRVDEKEFFHGWKDEPFDYRATECEYDFSFRADANGRGCIIESETIWLNYEVSSDAEEPDSEPTTLEIVRNGQGQIKSIKPEGGDLFRFIGSHLIRNEIPREELLIEDPWSFILGMHFPFRDLDIYNFNPRSLKTPASVYGKSSLREDGGNLAIVLKAITEDPEKRRMFLNLVTSVIPFVEDFEVGSYLNDSLQIQVKETFAESTHLPAGLMSDGTINVAALVAALYFEDGDVKVFEEPEKNIHPRLIGRIVSLLQEVSETKQVIVTTHSPEVVKYAGKDSLCLIQRDKSGNSTACWPGDSKTLKIFLEEDIGLDDLFVDELIGL